MQENKWIKEMEEAENKHKLKARKRKEERRTGKVSRGWERGMTKR